MGDRCDSDSEELFVVVEHVRVPPEELAHTWAAEQYFKRRLHRARKLRVGVGALARRLRNRADRPCAGVGYHLERAVRREVGRVWEYPAARARISGWRRQALRQSAKRQGMPRSSARFSRIP